MATMTVQAGRATPAPVQTPKPLPPMRNLGILTEKRINALIANILAMAGSKVTLDRSEIFLRIHDKHGRDLLTAAKLVSRTWHVRTVEGLVVRT